MTSKTVARLLADVDVGKSHSRPHVSNDNPFSESQFIGLWPMKSTDSSRPFGCEGKTLKYHSSFPGKFVGIDDALDFTRVLRLVQQRAPSQRHHAPDATRRPRRSRREN
jgi:putative transposase